MNEISINAVAAANEVASAIEGYRPDGLWLVDRESGSRAFVQPGRDFTEIRLGESAAVTIERPDFDYGGTLRRSNVTWSSSSSRDDGYEAAALTADVLLLAAKAAALLDEWAARGQLSRLSPEATSS